jgi:hypothetical protein
LWLAWGCAACQVAGSSVGNASEAAAPHLPAFKRFATWAERIERSDMSLQGEQALREATFAPLRGNGAVLWAEVSDAEGRALAFHDPIELDALSFVSVDGAELGNLRVAVSKSCRSRTRPATPCVVIARRSTGARPERSALVVAFSVEASPSG